MATKSERALRRREWSVKVFRTPDHAAAMEDADLRFWLGVPISERINAAWQLSEESFALRDQNSDNGTSNERRLSRSVVSITRR